MNPIHFGSLSLWLAALIFLAAAAVVWPAVGKLSMFADHMAGETGLGRAFWGLLFLGGITTLPDVAVTATAALSHQAGMAVSNLLGDFSIHVAALAVIDFWVR